MARSEIQFITTPAVFKSMLRELENIKRECQIDGRIPQRLIGSGSGRMTATEAHHRRKGECL